MTRVVVHRCGAHLVSCGIWQVDSLWPQTVCFIIAALPLRLHHRRDRCCCSCPRCSYHHVQCCCRAKLTQDPSQYCAATETSEVVRYLATCIFLCNGFMMCVAMVLRCCAARHGGAQQIGIIVRGVWWSGSICQVCFGHDGFRLMGLLLQDWKIVPTFQQLSSLCARGGVN